MQLSYTIVRNKCQIMGFKKANKKTRHLGNGCLNNAPIFKTITLEDKAIRRPDPVSGKNQVGCFVVSV